jgi:two-component system, chemotaxis family, sensor kinase CheA
MTSEDNAFKALLDDYIVECLPLSERIADQFVELERCWRSGEPADELLPAVKGTLHTVKGNSAMMGLTPMQDVAHALEDVCVLLTGEPDARGESSAALLVEGGGLLVDLVRTAGAGDGIEAAAAFGQRVRGFLAQVGRNGSAAAEHADRRKGDRRSAPRGPGTEVAGNVVRVDFRQLDTLLEVLGEGMIEHSAVNEAYRRLMRRVGELEELSDLDRAVVALEKTMKRMEAVVMGTRLLPISTVFGRFPRLVRDLAHTAQKRVRLVTSGGETPMDKAILDRLSEPLIHLLTNAVVHGLESREDRVRSGKPEEGVIELRAASHSGRVMIVLADDGRGLDEAKIQAKAEALGLEAAGVESGNRHAVIFAPGFSTAEQVSSLAGRGVGLDVVARSIHGLGGTIEVVSRPGQGLSFTLSLPLTLAIVRSLIIEVDRERFAVPISHVAETVRAEADAIHEINRRGVTLWRGDLIHVADGGELLGTTERADSPRRFYIVISSGAKRRGLMVDRLIGHQDVVVKGLDPALGHPDVVSGTTILGDGRVACILDAVRILDQRAAGAPSTGATERRMSA